MNWLFPEIKTTRNQNERFQKILDELNELNVEMMFKESDKIDKESIDVLHSVETFLRLRFKGREEELDKLIKSTIEKNSERGYYENVCH